MRTASTPFKSHIAQEVTTLALLWEVTRQDAVVYRFTNANNAIVVSGNTYRSDISFTASAISLSSSVANSQSVTIELAMDDSGIKETDVRARLFDGATGEIFLVNYEDPSMGVTSLFKGTFGEIKISDKHRCSIEIRPQGANAKSITYERYSQTCRASLGDARCTIDINALKVAITVTAVSGNVVVANELTQVENKWSLGYIKWKTGLNAGTKQLIQSSNLASKSVTLNDKPLRAMQVGDTADVFPGCNKFIETCRDVFANKDNFRGEPYVPRVNEVSLTYAVSTYVPPPAP